MHFDIVVAGGGPAGLSFAASLGGSGLSVAVVDKLDATSLADPPFDGREIALTHLSLALLKEIGAWDRIPAGDISEMHAARVLNGASTFAVNFDPRRRRPGTPLGHLVANHLIRRAVHDAAVALPEVTLLAGVSVARVETTARGATVHLSDDRSLTARLVVAADTRFSELRRRQGIPAKMLDFGRVMLVCRVAHERAHSHIATEWFDYGQTMATLPLNGNASSFVLTLPARQMDEVMAMDTETFDADITRRYRRRLGAMHLVSSRHTYPLVAVYAQRFHGTRFALVGDAAVGMHPVTAHGFNFGLLGANTLARGIKDAARRGVDIASQTVLHDYEQEHRRATLPTYLATNATARLYVDERRPARMVRDVALRVGAVVPPFRQMITARLMGTGRRVADAA
jgi:ubiquinone biosynthesis UbiH/UbiF/VisC/COQ6 family hydroxylase